MISISGVRMKCSQNRIGHKSAFYKWYLLPVILSVFTQSSSIAYQFFNVPGTYPGNIPALPNNLKCQDLDRDAMPYMNEIVLNWKHSTENTFKRQALIQGKIDVIYPAKRNSKGHTHTHFSIDINSVPGGDIELIFNDEFGPLPAVSEGMSVTACGQYITANERSHLPSPMGAIIHWIHYNPGDRDGGKQPHGFVIINGKPFGFSTPRGATPYRSDVF